MRKNCASTDKQLLHIKYGTAIKKRHYAHMVSPGLKSDILSENSPQKIAATSRFIAYLRRSFNRAYIVYHIGIMIAIVFSIIVKIFFNEETTPTLRIFVYIIMKIFCVNLINRQDLNLS
jgi:hypothetical protein